MASRITSSTPLGELQGNGVELDTWCARLGLARHTLKLFNQAKAAAQVDA
jgi:hypothetical protein